MSTNWRLSNGRFIIGQQLLKGELWIREGMVEAFWTEEELHQQQAKETLAGQSLEERLTDLDAYRFFDCQGAIVGPGFIDLHVHGGAGGDVMEAQITSFEKMGHIHGMSGTTRFLPTTVTSAHEQILQVCRTFQRWLEQLAIAEDFPRRYAGALPLGLHLEGPYINTAKKGAQNEEHIRSFCMTEFQQYQQASGHSIKMITLAPEKLREQQSMEQLREMGLVVSVGHTEASYEELAQAYKYGARHVTHLCNAMPSVHHRSPGPITFALNQDGMTVEFIADGHHVHPAMIELALRAKKQDEIAIVTDGISAVGMPDGKLDLGGLEVEVQGGVARLEDGTLAGSCLTMEKAYQFLSQNLSCSAEMAETAESANLQGRQKLQGEQELQKMSDSQESAELQLFQMMSSTPARILGVQDKLGSLERGKLADLVVIEQQQVKHVMVEGVWIKGGVE